MEQCFNIYTEDAYFAAQAFCRNAPHGVYRYIQGEQRTGENHSEALAEIALCLHSMDFVGITEATDRWKLETDTLVMEDGRNRIYLDLTKPRIRMAA